ncbi:WD40 repeat domain-containing protein [Streptomyces tropicalis]|uniref:WD40 repeat domain-containing protein n=1 Tax=Streptomyces tropicalis TaxID=3034234 RepID=A0ABT6ADS6_9ACTN|nr:WD40 repeat domain-containing protein [Streptomyces tropicalis]MDF3302481.1 WD40 repeat domain-containing protein [Streptomyces tropicalis]
MASVDQLFSACQLAIRQAKTAPAGLSALDRVQERVAPGQVEAAAAVLAVARALCDADRARQWLSQALSYWRCAQVLPLPWDTVVGPGAPFERVPGLAVVLDVLAEPGSGPVEAFAALVAQALAEAPPAELLTDVEHRVLCADDSGTEEGGSVSEVRLMLALLDDGPPGLFPDPERMTLIRATSGFADALHDAWCASAFAGQARCVLWAVEQADGAPARALGRVVGEAFVPALAALERRCSRSGLRMPVVLHELVCKLASRWDEAGVRARRLATALVGAVTAAVLVLLVLAASGWPHATNTVAAAERLTAEALSAESENPQLAAQLALAAYRLHPDDQTSGLLLQISEDEDFVLRRLNTGTGRLAAAAQDDRRQLIFTAGPDGGVRIWSLWSGALLGRLGRSSAVVALACGPDTPLLVGADSSGNVLLWHTGDFSRSPAPIHLATAAKDGAGVQTVALGFTPDGQSIYWVTGDGQVRVWDSRTRAMHSSSLTSTTTRNPLTPTTASNPYTAGLDKTASRILIGTEEEGIYSFDLGTLRSSRVLGSADLRGRVTALAADSTTGTLTATVGTEQGLAQWTLGTARREVFPYASVSRYVNALSYRSNATLAVATDRGTDLIGSDGTVLTTHSQGGYASQFATPNTADSQYLAVCSTGDTVNVVDIGGAGVPPASAEASTVLAYDTAGNLLLNDANSSNRTTDVYLVRPDPREPGRKASTSTRLRTLNPKTSWWTSGSAFYANEAALTQSFAAVAGQDPDGRAAVFVWDAKTGKPLRYLVFPGDGSGANPAPDAPPNIATSVVLDEQQHLMIARDTVGQVAAWSTHTWKQVFAIATGSTAGGDLALSPDGSTAALSIGTGRSQDLGPRNRLGLLDLHTHRLQTVPLDRWAYHLAYAPDGKHLAALSDDDTITFLDHRGHGTSTSPVIHLPGPALSIAYSPDGRYLAVGESLSRALVYRTDNGQLAYPAFRLPEGQAAFHVSFDPTGTLLTAAGGTLGKHPQAMSTYFWALSPQQWSDRVCSLAGQNLTHAAWNNFAGSTPYRRLCSHTG